MTTSLILSTFFNTPVIDSTQLNTRSITPAKINSFHNPVKEILFVSSYPPRECGIATYTQDLINAINNKFESSFICRVCALESDAEQHSYNATVKYILNTDVRKSFANVALAINRDPIIHAVVVQHEFGFFNKADSDFSFFCRNINKPIIFVFHTVLPNPDAALKTKVKDMSAIATLIIVMTNSALNILTEEYNVPPFKIAVIAHGTHLISPLIKEDLKSKYHFAGRKILSTFGLLSSGKGIEVTLNAMPDILVSHPDALFLIIGKTHPSVVKKDGEIYRNSLVKKVTEMHLENNVLFVNEYLPLHTILEYLQLTDIYLFTSKDPNQAVSGTLAYAVSCGCPIISTPIPHACEILENSGSSFIDFDDSSQLSDAVIRLLADENLRNNLSLNGLHKMAPTAWENAAIAHVKLIETIQPNTLRINYKIPEISLNHIHAMTTEIGIIQFAKIVLPDISSGYTLDDNACALIAMCQHFETYVNYEDLTYINRYLNFISHCLQSNGKFLNYVNNKLEFTNQNYSENLEDSNGRAIWALGLVVSLKDILPDQLCNDALTMLETALPHVDQMHSTRAMAFVIKGLFYINSPENTELTKTLADRLVQMYKHERKEGWHWYENYLTYGNSILPEAMLCAYLTLNYKEYEEIAAESFNFLLSKIFIDGKICVISNNGWMHKDTLTKSQIGGQQPIDVAYTIIALERFYVHYIDKEFKKKAVIAFNWFLGDNHLNQIIYNPGTGGCYDGLETNSINLNQGAESTISYLMARLAIERINLLEPGISITEYSRKELTEVLSGL